MRLFFWILISIISISCFFQTNFIYANSSTSTTVLSSQSFQKLGIEIEESIAGTYFAGDGILIRGRVTNKKEYAMVFLQNAQTGEEFSELARTDSGGYFKIPLLLPKITGKYYIIIASGNSFETTIPEAITLVSRDALFESKSTILSSIPNIVYDNNSSYLSFGSDIWSNISIQQGGKTIETSGKILVLSDLPLTSGEAKIYISGYHLSGTSPLDRIPGTEFIYSGTILIDRTRDRIGKEFTTLRNRKSLATMQFRLKSGERVSSTYYLSSPNGNVMKNTFPSNVIDASGFLHTNILIRQNFQIPEIGVYKIETVRDNGYAYFNLPISRSQFWSIGESMSKIKKTTLRSNKDLIDEDILSRINLVRKTLSRDPLEKDSKLMELAQKKAMDMAEYNYVGHITHSGKNILDFAKSIQIDITGSIGENVAGGNVSDIHLQDGLEESGSHKYNMINPKWKHIGIGYVLKNGRTYFVQVFGE